MSRIKPAEVRFYIDADIRGLGLLLGELRADLTYPGDPGGVVHKRERPPCPVTKVDTPDTKWIPIAAQNRWLIITRDRHIQENRREVDSVRENGARMVALSALEARNTFEQLEIVMTQWRSITQLLGEQGPFIYTATRTSLRPVPLD